MSPPADKYRQERRELTVAGCAILLVLVAVGNFLYFVHLSRRDATPFRPARLPMGRPLEATPH